MAKKEFLEERHGKILDHVNKLGRADVGELAEILQVGEATVRRDLVALEKQGRLLRAHGGAIKSAPVSVWQTSNLHDRLAMNEGAKTRIAAFVEQLVHDGDSIMIDGGSTNLLVARTLCSKKSLLVVTNAPAMGELLVNAADHKVIVTGGEFLKETSALIGNAAEQALRQYRTDKAILGVSGLLSDEGCFSAIPQEAEIKRLMSLNAAETIVVADSSKIGARAFCFTFDFARVNKLVTDKGISPEDLEKIRDQGVEVFTV